MVHVTDRDDWFEVWFEDRESILSIMVRNMAADLNAGYDYFGQSIATQRREISRYKAETESALDKFKDMNEKEVNRWCFYELKKHGAIE